MRRSWKGPIEPERFFSPQEIERARTYHRPLYRAYALSTAIGVTYLAVLAFTSAGRWLAAPVDDLPKWAFALSYAASIVVVGAVLRLPLSVWRGFVHEHRWGFSTQSLGGFLADRLKGVTLTAVLTSVALLGLVEIASALPNVWPVVAQNGAAAFVVVLSFAGPVVFEPLFNRFRPLKDEALATEVRALSVAAGVPVRDVLVADASRRTRKENAYVSGLGRTRRVVLYDTLLSRASSREIRLVVAHELGHRRAHHVALGTALGAAGAIVAVWFLGQLLRRRVVLAAIGASGPGDPRVIPFVLLAVAALELYALPIGAAISRQWEAAADRASIELTGDAVGFAEMERNLALANLLDLAPGRLVYLLLFTHPTPAERIAASGAGPGDGVGRMR